MNDHGAARWTDHDGSSAFIQFGRFRVDVTLTAEWAEWRLMFVVACHHAPVTVARVRGTPEGYTMDTLKTEALACALTVVEGVVMQMRRAYDAANGGDDDE